jgi:hypothetical protein
MSSLSKLLLTSLSFRKVNFPRYNSVLFFFYASSNFGQCRKAISKSQVTEQLQHKLDESDQATPSYHYDH